MAGMTAAQPTTLLTPDDAGLVSCGETAGTAFGACFYAEGWLPENTPTLQPFWHDDRFSQETSVVAATRAHALAHALQTSLDGQEDEASLCLFLDLADLIVEIGTERMIRLSQFGGIPERVQPDQLSYEMRLPVSGTDLKTLQKSQAFQWQCLRALAGADDKITFTRDRADLRLRHRVHTWRTRRRAEGSANRRGSLLFGANLRGYAELFCELGYSVSAPPNLVRRPAMRRDHRARQRVAELIGATLSEVASENGIAPAALDRYATLWAAVFPETRVETRVRTRDAYRRWFDRNDVAGFLTETGQARYDANMFFASECVRRGIPTGVIQHGGLYGFDALIPGYFVCDLGWSDYFFSWGWKEFAGGYPATLQRARIMPMPNPKLSRLAEKSGWSSDRPRTLLVPLSKFRTLDNRLGGNATDCHLESSRSWTWEVIRATSGDFDKIIITYRAKSFESDLIARWLAESRIANVEILPASEAPASDLIRQVYAVVWDVSASGFLETLHAGVPTVVRVPRGRWAVDWADALMRENGIAVETAAEAQTALRSLLDRPDIWPSTLERVRPFLDGFARVEPGFRDAWRGALKSCF